jgi:hypothetical protein
VLQDNQKSTLAKVTDSLSVAVSTSTVRRRAHEMGFNNRVAVKKPFANDINQRKRLAFARKHVNWKVADWSKVIWSDESSFEIGKKSKQVKVWREKKDQMNPECLEPTFKSGRSSTSIWGAFYGTSKIPIVLLESGPSSPTPLDGRQRTISHSQGHQGVPISKQHQEA